MARRLEVPVRYLYATAELLNLWLARKFNPCWDSNPNLRRSIE